MTDLHEAVDERYDNLERRLERSKRETEVLVDMIEDKTRALYQAQDELRSSKQFLESVLASMRSAIIITDDAGIVTSVGGATCRLTGHDEDALVGQPVRNLLRTDSAEVSDCVLGLGDEPLEAELATADDGAIPVLATASPLEVEAGDHAGFVCIATDISERKQLEAELRNAQRLESIGQLAAGVAHEINTPIQYIGDSVRFVGDVIDDLLALHDDYGPLREIGVGADEQRRAVEAITDHEEEIDLEFIQEESTKAVARTLEGIERVSTIVRALKQFAHPGGDKLAPADINQVLETTLVVARNEFKYVAETELNLGEIPEILCDRGDLGQVFLNLVVNAGHAMADNRNEGDPLGKITITTSPLDDGVLVEIADTGGGIPAEIRDRVFEPFFTTKEPGRGTGQGLFLAHNTITKKHKGRLSFEVVDGVGTTFAVWLPRTVVE